jgi:fructokinase
MDGADHAPAGDAPVLGIGELLWDLLPDGPRLGGAPFNTLVHLARLGHPSTLVAAVGDDELGHRARAAAGNLGVDPGGIQVVRSMPTGVVDVRLDAAGDATYTFPARAAYQTIDTDAAIRVATAIRPAAIVLGTLAQQAPSVRATTRAILAMFPDALVVYDANLRPGQWRPSLVRALLDDADVLRCDRAELAAMGHAPDRLLVRHALQAVIVTAGPDGATAWSREGEVHVAAPHVRVVDTIGAGDAFTAAITHALLAGASLRAALEQGTALAAHVVSMAGALGVAAPTDPPSTEEG